MLPSALSALLGAGVVQLPGARRLQNQLATYHTRTVGTNLSRAPVQSWRSSQPDIGTICTVFLAAATAVFDDTEDSPAAGSSEESRNNLAGLALQAVRSLTIAELHGAACGLAVHGPEALGTDDLIALLGTEALQDAGSVQNFVQATQEALYADDMSFSPLLLAEEPSDFDAAGCEMKATALSDWCSAFLAGLAAGFAMLGDGPELAGGAGVPAIGDLAAQLPDDGQEIVQDMLAIAQLDTAISTSDEADTALIELEEYLKVGTLLIMTLLGAASARRTELPE